MVGSGMLRDATFYVSTKFGEDNLIHHKDMLPEPIFKIAYLNSLPDEVTSLQTLAVFWKLLKTHLLHRSYNIDN